MRSTPKPEHPPYVAQSDLDLMTLWLHGKSVLTQSAYRHDVNVFLEFLGGKSLVEVTLNDLQAYANHLGALGYANASIARNLAAVKSLLSFINQLGRTPVNLGSMIQPPKGKNKLAERILSEEQVHALIEHANSERDRVLIRFLYGTGARCMEATSLKWRDIQELPKGNAQVNLFGKGSKTRVVLISSGTWQLLKGLRGEAGLNDPVFRSQKFGPKTGYHLTGSHVCYIVRQAAKRAGIEGNVSPHWLRHSHASHSLERGASIQLVKESLGHSSLSTTERYLHARPNDGSGLYLSV